MEAPFDSPFPSPRQGVRMASVGLLASCPARGGEATVQNENDGRPSSGSCARWSRSAVTQRWDLLPNKFKDKKQPPNWYLQIVDPDAQPPADWDKAGKGRGWPSSIKDRLDTYLAFRCLGPGTLTHWI